MRGGERVTTEPSPSAWFQCRKSRKADFCKLKWQLFTGSVWLWLGYDWAAESSKSWRSRSFLWTTAETVCRSLSEQPSVPTCFLAADTHTNTHKHTPAITALPGCVLSRVPSVGSPSPAPLCSRGVSPGWQQVGINRLTCSGLCSAWGELLAVCCAAAPLWTQEQPEQLLCELVLMSRTLLGYTQSGFKAKPTHYYLK